jgi:hypothetical protein
VNIVTSHVTISFTKVWGREENSNANYSTKSRKAQNSSTNYMSPFRCSALGTE